MLQKQEYPNNTDAQVREYLEKALQAVEELAPPDDLRVALFGHAVQLYSTKQVMLEQIMPGGILAPNAGH